MNKFTLFIFFLIFLQISSLWCAPSAIRLFSDKLTGTRPHLVFKISDDLYPLNSVSFEVTSISGYSKNIFPDFEITGITNEEHIIKYRYTENIIPGDYNVKVKTKAKHNNDNLYSYGSFDFSFSIIAEDTIKMWITPNPSTGSQIKIKYFLSRYCEKVLIRIYDKSGKLIFINEDADGFASFNEYRWNKVYTSGKKVAIGTYFIVLEAWSDEKKSHLYRGTVTITK